jgi:hypothetical protein
MLGFELLEKLFDWPGAPLPSVFQALANSLSCIRLRGDVQKALVCLRVLNDGRGLPVHSKNDWTLAFFNLFEKFGGAAAEGG